MVCLTAASHQHFAVLGLGAPFVAIDGDVADFFGRRALLAVAGRGRLRRFLRDGDRGRGRGDQREGRKRTEHAATETKSGVSGQRESVQVALRGRRSITKKTTCL